MKTAYIELNTHNHICALAHNSKKPSFLYKGIVFYPNTTVTSLPEILRKDYRYFILDMGVLTTYTANEFLTMVVGALPVPYNAYVPRLRSSGFTRAAIRRREYSPTRPQWSTRCVCPKDGIYAGLSSSAMLPPTADVSRQIAMTTQQMLSPAL